MTEQANQSINLSPDGLIDDDDAESGFMLAQSEWLTLQRYINEALALPTNAEQLRRELMMQADEPVTPFGELISTYATINQNCTTWRDITFPSTVNLADAIVQYTTKVPIYYKALRDVMIQIRRKKGLDDTELRAEAHDMLDELAADATTYADQAQHVKEQIVAFSHATKADQTALKQLDTTMSRYIGNLDQRILDINNRLTQLRQEIDQYNKDYEKSVVVATTTLTYAWVFPIGLIAGAIVAGVYGDAAAKLKQRIDQARDENNQLSGELRTKSRLKDLTNRADQRVDQIQALLSPALVVIQKIEGGWRALANDLNSVKNDVATIEQSLFAEQLVSPSFVTVVVSKWKALAKNADAYRLNAFIDMQPVPAVSQ